jgi:putative heme iron utilization protein
MTQITSPAQPKDQLTQAIEEALAKSPNIMTPVLARKLDVPEMEVIRRLPGDGTVELDLAQWEAIIRSFEALGNVFVINTNPVCVLENEGTFSHFSTIGEYFNVQDPTLDMHIRYREIAAIFAVEKPSHTDGAKTQSFQFFGKDGRAGFKVFLTFGGQDPSPERQQQFTDIRNRFILQ